MPRYLKLAALTAGGILLLLLTGAGLISIAVDPNDYKDDIVRLAQERHQRTLSIPGTIGLTFYPRIGANLGRVTLSEHASKAEFAAIDSARVSVALMPLLLRREVVIDRIDVRGMRASVVRFADGSMNTGDLTSVRPAPGAGAAGAASGGPKVLLAIDSIRISNARLLFDDRKSGRTLDISHLNIDSGAIARGVPGRMALSANVRMSKPAINTAVTMTTRFMPDRERRRIAFTDFEANLDVSLKDARVKVGGQMEVDLDRDEFAADLKGGFDDSKFDIKAGLRDKAYSLTLHVDKVDLGRYQERLAPPAGSGDPLPPEEGEAIDLSPLSALRASGGIHIGELTMGSLRASNVRTALRSDGGRMILQPMAASVYGGSSSGSMALDFTHSASTPHITLVQTLKGVQVGPLLKDLLGKAPLDGRGDLAIDVKTAGATSMQMRQHLSGSASLRLAEGRINGVDIGAMIAGGEAASGLAGAGLSTGFSDLSASFTIADGVAHNADLSAHATLLNLTGAGAIDLAREQVDYTLACTLAATGISLPVRLAGPWEAITWRVDGTTISGAAVRQKARDKLKNAIRGLLKR